MSLLSKINKNIKKIFNPSKVKKTYPFVHMNDVYPVKFNINNRVEEFRLKKWGGEKEYIVEMISELKADDVLFDIGSSVGLISVIAANILKQGKTISFEPDPENIMRLRENYKVNGLTNFVVMPIAVGTEKSTMQLFTAGSGSFSPSLQKVNGIENSIEVAVNSIDNLLRENAIPYPTFIKIDIEGAEMMALKGMNNLLKSDKRPRVLFIEIHPAFLPSFNTSVQDIFDYLSGLNYRVDKNVERDEQILCKLVPNKI